jgi:hypothetical protein
MSTAVTEVGCGTGFVQFLLHLSASKAAQRDKARANDLRKR